MKEHQNNIELTRERIMLLSREAAGSGQALIFEQGEFHRVPSILDSDGWEDIAIGTIGVYVGPKNK